MSEPLDVAQWARNWEALARQAQASFPGNANAGQPAWSAGQASGNPWAEALFKSAPFAGGKQQSEAIEHLMSGAQGYLGMLQSMASAASGHAGGFGNLPGSGFLGAMTPPAAMGNPFAAAMRSFGSQGARGFEQMMEQFSAVAGPMFDKAKAGLHQPAFGHLREKQENLQKTAQVFIDYQEQSARYDRLMLKVGERSFARFQLKLAEREEPGRQIDSVRGLYDLWIDAAEEAYAEIALSEEFREVYAAVVDAQMRVRQQVQGEIERFCGELGMPTRSEVSSIGERLQAVRRELREEREKQDELRIEVAALNLELAALRSGSTSAAKSAGPITPVEVAKPDRTRKTATEKAPVHSAAAAETRKTAKKPRRKALSKATPLRRGKRSKSAAGKPAEVAIAVARSPGRKDRSAAAAGSFAASIARFARKSKSSSTRSAPPRAKPKAVKRGGGK